MFAYSAGKARIMTVELLAASLVECSLTTPFPLVGTKETPLTCKYLPLLLLLLSYLHLQVEPWNPLCQSQEGKGCFNNKGSRKGPDRGKRELC